MSLATYTLIHVLISFAGIASALVVLYPLLTGKRLDGWMGLSLATTVAASVTGFGFPCDHLLPSHKVGIIPLVLLVVVILARYVFHLAGGWRIGFVISAAIALYLKVFGGVVQSFEKVPALKALAQKQSEPPLPIAQLVVVLLVFSVLTIFAAVRFHPERLRTA
jgi:hypothetical protein